MTWIQTWTGRQIDLLKPRPEDICIEDIAHALARICRYTGHVETFYSVAEHSVHVAMSVPGSCILEGLLHDAAEAYIQDLSSPLKRVMRQVRSSAYDVIYARVEKAIIMRFGLSSYFPPEVEDADRAVLLAEYEDLGFASRADRPWNILGKRGEVKIECWGHEEAEKRFLDLFGKLQTRA